MEGSLMAFKVFTNGSTLQASEVNDNLMRQAVATFSNAAARTAAITAPSEGMLTWLEDVNRYESFGPTGTWVPAFGLTHVSTVNFTAQNAVNLDNLFTSAYDNYKIIFTLTHSGSSGFYVQLRAGGSTVAGTDYKYQTVRVTGTSVSGLGSTSTNAWPSFNSSGANRNENITINLYDPARAIQTVMDWSAWTWDGSQFGGMMWGFEGNNSVRDGIRFTTDAGFTLTGSVRIYGYRNS
jgi:hypothetical protein